MDNNIKISSNRSFGIIFFFVFCLIAFYPLLKDGEIRIWSISVALLFLILGLINSRLLTPLNRLWFKFGIFLAKFVSPIVMAFVFFGVVIPTGLLMKFFKKDILKLKKNSSKTYWIKKTEEKSSMKNQF